MSNVVDRTFVVDDVTYEIIAPESNILDEAYKAYNTAFANAINSKALLRAKLDDFVREQGLWNEKKDAEVTSISKQIRDYQISLEKGGIKLSQAREIAIKIRKLRIQLRRLMSVKSELDNNTAEGQADNARFNYLVSACTVYNDTKKPVYKDVADYLNNSTKKLGIESATKFASVAYDLKDNYEEELPENKFLKERGFVNSDLHLINKDGKLIDEDGHLVDKDGFYINDNNQRVDIDGNLLDENGNYILDKKPFLDDDGNEIE